MQELAQVFTIGLCKFSIYGKINVIIKADKSAKNRRFFVGNFKSRLDKHFGISAKGSNFKTEIIAGLTTFMTMVYILPVNADMFGALGLSFGGMYITTALAAIVGTLMMALYAKLPYAQAPGMGLNAFFVFTVCLYGYGYSYQNALVIVLVSGILFTLLTLGGIREKIVRAVPTCVKLAIAAGIGLFIAFIGLQKAGIIVADGATLVKIASFKILGDGALTFAQIMPMLVTLVTVFFIAALSKKKVKGSLLWGMLGGTALYYLLAWVGKISIGVKMDNPFNSFKEFGKENIGQVFAKGFSGLFDGSIASVIQFVAIFISFAMVDMFDTIGTLLGTAQRANMLDEKGELPNMPKALLCDSVASMAGALLGTSTVTTYVESSAGIAEGGRTGFTSLVIALLFTLALFLSPIAQLIPGCATAAALIYVGVLMIGGIKHIDWDDASAAVPAFLTIIMMPLTYNISYGIAFGFISYVVIKLITGKVKDIHPITAVLAVLFIANFLFVTH